tara:strand:- start:250 stop:414 length:165 start_codon:yes stop_codon:yes gene_type:complete
VKYRITYEKINEPVGLFPTVSTTIVEAKDVIQATVKALGDANDNERVKAIELVA